MIWKCPKCGGDDLVVEVQIVERARLIQYDGNFETDCNAGNHEWGAYSPMECRDCEYEAVAGEFEVQED